MTERPDEAVPPPPREAPIAGGDGGSGVAPSEVKALVSPPEAVPAPLAPEIDERTPPPPSSCRTRMTRVCGILRTALNTLLILLVFFALLVLLVLSGTQTKCAEVTNSTMIDGLGQEFQAVTEELNDLHAETLDDEASCADTATVTLLVTLGLLFVCHLCRQRKETKRDMEKLAKKGRDVETLEKTEKDATKERSRRAHEAVSRSTSTGELSEEKIKRLRDEAMDKARLQQAFLACDAGTGTLDGRVSIATMHAICLALGAQAITLSDVQRAVVNSISDGGETPQPSDRTAAGDVPAGEAGGGAGAEEAEAAAAAAACRQGLDYARFEQLIQSNGFKQLLPTKTGLPSTASRLLVAGQFCHIARDADGFSELIPYDVSDNQLIATARAAGDLPR